MSSWLPTASFGRCILPRECNSVASLQSTGFCCPCSNEEMLNRLVSSRLWSRLLSSSLAMPFILYWWQYVWLWKILAVSFVRPPTGGRELLHELTTLSATEALLSLVVESRTVCQLLTYTRRRQQFRAWTENVFVLMLAAPERSSVHLSHENLYSP